MNSNYETIVRGYHKGEPEECEACKNSTRQQCPYCEHALTGAFTNDGHTVCENCGEVVWLGVGNAND